ncbi:hypothetical protein JCM21900_006679 [Sporobolomyces salmonicolor]
MSAPVLESDSVPPASHTGQAGVKPPASELGQQLQEVQDQARGATVHSFDPFASPSQKAQQALKGAKGAIPSLDLSSAPSLRGSTGGTAVASDAGSNGKKVEVTAGPRDSDKATKEEALQGKEGEGYAGDEERARGILKGEGRISDDGVENPPGAMPEKEAEKGKVREIPSWFAIGWTGQDRTLFLAPEDAKKRSILEDFVSDAYYGEWYHNAGIITFSVVASHFITLFGGGLGWLILILAVCATYYQTSIKRVRRNVRDDMAREVAKKGLRNEVESVTWLNLFMQRFWLIYEPVLSATIVASVDQVLSVSTPGFLDSIRMTTFTLGTKPPHIDHVQTFPDTEDDVVLMEWKVSFIPNDVKDMTHAQSAKKVNPKIVLNVRFGVGPATLGKDIVVEDISFAGTMRIKLKLMNNFPHVQTVDLSFMQPPVFDFVLKPIGFDLSLIPGLSPFITQTVHSILAPMMYDPNAFTLNLEQLLSGAPIDTAVGVLAVTVHSGKGLRGVKLGGGAPDPYVSFSISGRAELARTSTKRSTSSPHWKGETKYILLNNLNDTLTMTLFDWNDHRPDNDIGTVNFDLKSLHKDGEQIGKTGEVIYDGKARGHLKFDAVYYPVLQPKKQPDGTLEPVPETTSGVVRLVVHQAKDLDPRGQQINPFFTVTLNDQSIHRSQTLKRTPNPIWERATEFLVTNKSSAVVGLTVKDDNSILADSKLGVCKVRLMDLLEANKKGNDWFPLSHARSGKVRVSAEWKPVLMTGAINGAGVYSPPIGVVRLWFKRSQDLKNVEALTGGKSDPYVRVLHGGIIVGRTVVHNNDLDPEYDEIIYVQVHSPRDEFVIEVMDYQHLTKDRTLGSTQFAIAGLIAEGPDKKTKPWVGTGKVARTDVLRSDAKRTVKGNIQFEAEFFPCVPLKNVSFKTPEPAAINEEVELDGANDDKSFASPPTSPVKSITSVNGTASANGDGEAREKEKEEEMGIDIPREQLLKAQTGVLCFQIVSGQLAKKGARLEVLFDDGYWSAYSTEPSRSTHNTWDEIGEALIRELDFSQIIFRLNMAEKDTREEIIASATVDMNTFLEAALDKPATFTLTAPDGSARSTVVIAAKYVPVEMEILPRESINNSGLLRVDLLDAKGLPSADKNGKSDPYAVFELDGKRVHKSEVVKKTLAPVWNEKFECEVARKDIAKLTLTVYDWDRVGNPDKLGRATIDLASLEPMEPKELSVDLKDTKTNASAGTVRLRLLHRPGFLIRSRHATSTFSGGRVGTVLGGVGGGVLAVGGGVGGAGMAVGKSLGHGVTGVGKGAFKGIRKIEGLVPGGNRTSTVRNGDLTPVPSTDGVEPSGVAVSTISAAGSPVQPPAERLNNANGSGLATAMRVPATSDGVTGASVVITVGQLSGLGEGGEKKAVHVKLNGGKTLLSTHHHKGAGDAIDFNETISVKAAEGPMELSFAVVHPKTIGSDKLLGTATLSLWEHVNATKASSTVNLPVVGTEGNLQVSLNYVPPPEFSRDSRPPSIAGSVASSPSHKQRSRFSSFGRSPKPELTTE